VQTIENMTGARIDHVVVTNFTKFTDLVDTIGPITVDNPAGSKRAADERGVYYTFPKGPLTITDGHMALAFVRQRLELANGDLDRTLRQRAFLKAVALKLATPEVLANPAKLTSIIETISKYVSVDAEMTDSVIYSLGFSLSGITSGEQIHMVMAPILGFDKVGTEDIDVVDVAGVTALGKALQTDTMPAFVAKWPSTEYGYTPSPKPSASSSAPSTKASATATPTKKKT
jgi:anionic cell wall polymer biosynthesis LytR-Cps2A-Psr (LCP) family protein